MARVLVVGGTGVISAPCVAELLRIGHQVFALNRGTARAVALPSGCHRITGDRDDPAALAAALAQVAPDAVVDFACFTGLQAQGLVAALTPACRQIVLVSTVDVYGLPLPRLPMGEDRPWAATASAYAAEKRRAEDVLHSARTGATGLTILRPTYSMGPGFLISLFDRSGAELVARLRLSLPILLPDGGDRLIHPSDATDTGRMIAHTVGAEAAMGCDFTVGTPGGQMRQRDYLALVAAALGTSPVFHEVEAPRLARHGVLDDGSLWTELTVHSLAYDLSRYRARCPGFTPAPDLARQVRSYAARLDPARDPFRAEGAEARALAVLGQGPASRSPLGAIR